MNRLDGMLEAFKEAKQVYLTTTSPIGETRMRPMTNFNARAHHKHLQMRAQ
jgi:hypothetical protein